MGGESGAESPFQALLLLPKALAQLLPWPLLSQPPGSEQGSLTGSENASLSSSRQTRRMPDSTHVMRVLQAEGGENQVKKTH